MKFIFTFILMILSVSLWAQIPAEHIKEAMDITPQEACLAGICPGSKTRFWDKQINQCRCIDGVTKINKIDIESQKCEYSIENAINGVECKFQAGKCECAIRKVSREREICAQGYCPGLTVRYWDEKSGKCVCMKNKLPKNDNIDLNGCVRNVKQSIECPEGTYKFDSSTINSGRIGGKDIETQSGSGSIPNGGGTPSRRSSQATKQ